MTTTRLVKYGLLPPREVAFVRLGPDYWATDAVLAITRGPHGRKVYPEAIYCTDADMRDREITLLPRHLRELFGAEPRMRGWRSNDPLSTGFPTADRAYWDTDHVSVALARKPRPRDVLAAQGPVTQSKAMKRSQSSAAKAESLRDQVRDILVAAWAESTATGKLPNSVLPAEPADRLRAVEVNHPANPEHGDFATNLAFRLAKPAGRAPEAVAALLAGAINVRAKRESGFPVTEATVAGRGFLNLRLSGAALEGLIPAILANPHAFGRVAPRAGGKHINVEFVSANPTGPLTVGNARGAFVGDLLARVLEAGGQRVTREYYFNDAGSQIAKLGASALALRAGRDIPEDGYRADYVAELAANLPDELATESLGADLAVGRWAAAQVRGGIEASLEGLGVHFDVWTSEGRLHSDGWIARALDRLRAAGHVYDRDGATWFRSTDFGDDKDRVVVKSDGELTYFAADIGYLEEKFSRGFDHLIFVWGADHHGTVARVRNAAVALGHPADSVEMVLTGWVRFIRNGVEIAMSKRAGTFITLDELLVELGSDAARWFFASRGANVNMDVDLELAKRQSSENPVYYVQYAHARIASILRKAAEAGLTPASDIGGLLAGPAEAKLARVIARFPEVVADAAAAHETQGITAYATEIATTFHGFYRDAQVIDSANPERSAKRLALVAAARITLANALGLLGVTAPDQMRRDDDLVAHP